MGILHLLRASPGLLCLILKFSIMLFPTYPTSHKESESLRQQLAKSMVRSSVWDFSQCNPLYYYTVNDNILSFTLVSNLLALQQFQKYDHFTGLFLYVFIRYYYTIMFIPVSYGFIKLVYGMRMLNLMDLMEILSFSMEILFMCWLPAWSKFLVSVF